MPPRARFDQAHLVSYRLKGPPCEGFRAGLTRVSQYKKAPPDWQGFSLSLFAVFRLALSGGFLFLGERFRQTVHGGCVIDAFNGSELTGHAIQGAFIELAL